jgi:hypothetical protein
MTPDTPDTDRTDAEADPAACSLCGTHIGAFGGEYCDPCARDIGAKEPLRTCLECGQRGPGEQMTSIDVSPPDEYYPEIKYLCRSCAEGDD